MKIEWIDRQREVPKVGILSNGDVRDVSEEIGRALISQGQAIEITEIEDLEGGEE